VPIRADGSERTSDPVQARSAQGQAQWGMATRTESESMELAAAERRTWWARAPRIAAACKVFDRPRGRGFLVLCKRPRHDPTARLRFLVRGVYVTKGP
jgi:hypothetical protein